MSKYQPLADHLSTVSDDVVRLSFEEIDRILGRPLPPSAYRHDAFWANSSSDTTHSWARLWMLAGWERSELSREERWVVFRRRVAREWRALDSSEAREGYERDQKILVRGRSRALAIEARERDDHTCQACGFRLSLGDQFVIEVHHRRPLASTGEVTTSLEDLVSLCPTCHRIAHLQDPPLEVAEITAIRRGRAPTVDLDHSSGGSIEAVQPSARDPGEPDPALSGA